MDYERERKDRKVYKENDYLRENICKITELITKKCIKEIRILSKISLFFIIILFSY